MELRPVSDALGIEVLGLDLTREVSHHDRERLRRAYADHHLLRLHCPGLSDDDHLRFAALFGPLWDEMTSRGLCSYVSNVREDRIIDKGALLFHSDLAFTPIPTLGISLYAVEVPADGAPTFFANAVRAWSRLPAPLRERLSPLTGRHLFDLTSQRGDVPYKLESHPENEPRAEHPLCMRHPDSGREILYASRMQTDRILELPADESDAILAELFSTLYSPDNIYEHRWRAGDLLVWDNLALQHARDDMPEVEARTLRRVTLATAGVADQVPGFNYPGARSGSEPLR